MDELLCILIYSSSYSSFSSSIGFLSLCINLGKDDPKAGLKIAKSGSSSFSILVVYSIVKFLTSYAPGAGNLSFDNDTASVLLVLEVKIDAIPLTFLFY